MKRVLILLLVVVMVAGVVGGTVAYGAGSHDDVKGDKLIGNARLGGNTVPPNPDFVAMTGIFDITNPDCKKSAMIEQLSILDKAGNVVYEGPFLERIPQITPGIYCIINPDSPTSTVVTELSPHQTVTVHLSLFMPDGQGGFLPHSQTMFLCPTMYTVEVEYKTSGLPLVGSGFQVWSRVNGMTSFIEAESQSAVPMWNARGIRGNG